MAASESFTGGLKEIVGLISPSPFPLVGARCVQEFLCRYFSTRSGFFLARSLPLCSGSPLAVFCVPREPASLWDVLIEKQPKSEADRAGSGAIGLFVQEQVGAWIKGCAKKQKVGEKCSDKNMKTLNFNRCLFARFSVSASGCRQPIGFVCAAW